MSRYRILSHTADTGIVAVGATLEEVFENAAFGMFDLMFDLSLVPPEEECHVEVEGDDPAELLVAWLSALLTEADIRGLAFCRFRLEGLRSCCLSGGAAGSAAARLILRGPPIKAVTYHGLAVEETPEGWAARVIFDV
ncbi:MAG: archease [Acidimicrobiia bacterium]|nr:archease [Acidimicrobiia bacterium]